MHFVSVLTPTYNRRKFLPSLIECYKAQDYPLSSMEWIILDDGEDCVKDLFEQTGIPNIRYIRLEEKLLIGAKRNILNREAKGSILVAMDDDDYYSNKRVSHAVKMLTNSPLQVAGSSEMYVYYTDVKHIYKVGPFAKDHATNGTMAWKKSYSDTHLYDERVAFAEERSFLVNYSTKLIQLDPFQVMLVMSHSDNTFNKKQMRDKRNPFVKLTTLNIDQFISSPTLREFYVSA
jgi:glycosyltransferase involved in cell wall biosynthesis